MAESPMVGARVPQDWQQQISALAAAGRKEAEIVRDAIADLQERVTNVEQKLASLGRLVG